MLKDTLQNQLRDMLESNILSFKEINNQIVKVHMNLEGYTKEVNYFTNIVGQIEKFCDYYKQGNIPTYSIPSENVKLILKRMDEKFDTILKNIDMMRELISSDTANGIPDNQVK